MSEAAADSLPWGTIHSQNQKSKAAEATPGGSESVSWVVVAVNLNPGEAAIIKGRLESQDIPSVVQQEAVGSVLGLTVGPLGSARVLVPEPLAEQALDILAETFEIDDQEDFEEEEWET